MTPQTTGNAGFLSDIRTRIRSAQYQALRAATRELVALYRDLGKAIHEKQQSGKAVVETLAADLRVEFPGQSGFSAANFWLMRQFFTEYRDHAILEPLVREISWAKNRPSPEEFARRISAWAGETATGN